MISGLAGFFVFFFLVRGLDVDGYGDWDDNKNFLSALSSRGLNITRTSESHDFKIFGDYTYTSVLINTDKVDANKLVDFVNNGNSVVVVLNEESKELAHFVMEVGLLLSDDPVKESSCRYTSPDKETSVKNLKCGGLSLTVGSDNASAVYYPVLNNTEDKIFAYAIQGVNDARIVVFSSSAFLSDDVAPTEANLKIAVDLTLWAFKLKGLLRYSNLTYIRLADGLVNVPELAINDNITFSITLESFNTDENGKGQWKPFTASDVQLQYSMLVPRIRKTLVPGRHGVHSLTFRLPDIFGIYQFIVDYQPWGYTHINATHTVRMRPYRHNEFPRYLSSAYPFYTVAFVMLVGVIFVSVVFVLHAPIFNQGVDPAYLNFSSSSSSSYSSSSGSSSPSISSSPALSLSPPVSGTSSSTKGKSVVKKSGSSASPTPTPSKKKAEGKTTTNKKE